MGKLRLISDSLQTNAMQEISLPSLLLNNRFADCICLQYHNLRFCSKTKCTADRHRLSTEAYLRLIGPIKEKRLSLLTCSSSWTKPLTQMFRLYHLQNFSKHMKSTSHAKSGKTCGREQKEKQVPGRSGFLSSSCCEFGIMRSDEFVEVVLHLLQHGIA